MIFDSHAHYDDAAFETDREKLLTDMRREGVGYIVNVGASLQGAADSVALAERFPDVYAAVGVHPDHAAELDEQKLAWLEALCRRPKTVAVGEIGLDYYWDKASHDVQKNWFSRQLALAKKADLPVVIHSREAAQDTFDIIKAEHAGSTGGVIHCYSGSKEMAKGYLDMGYEIGIGGVVTFKNAKTLKEVTEYVPLERILIETDCPYLAPAPYRGKRNSSLYLPYIIRAIAEIKGISAEEVERVTCENAKRMYRIGEAGHENRQAGNEKESHRAAAKQMPQRGN